MPPEPDLRHPTVAEDAETGIDLAVWGAEYAADPRATTAAIAPLPAPPRRRTRRWRRRRRAAAGWAGSLGIAAIALVALTLVVDVLRPRIAAAIAAARPATASGDVACAPAEIARCGVTRPPSSTTDARR